MKTKNELKERSEFLAVYAEFDRWLKNMGFRKGHYWKESATVYDCLYSHYNEHIDDLYAVEHYLHDAVKLSIRFLRDRNEHKFMFVGEMGTFSKVYSLPEMKEEILSEVRKLRDEKIKELESAMNL